METLYSWETADGLFTIRRAEEADLPALLELTHREYAAIYAGFEEQIGEVFPLIYHPIEDKTAQVTGSLRQCQIYVTEHGGELVAYITFFVNGAVGTIGNNAVSQKWRGNGIAGRQMSFAFEEMKRQGAVCARVGTNLDEAHAPARRAYEKAGFDRRLESVTYFKML